MSNKINSVPEGWELVRIGVPIIGEWVVGMDGRPLKWSHETFSSGYAIIRKLEKPKQYRPFSNAAEAEPFWDRKLRPKSGHAAILRIVVLGEARVGIGNSGYTYGEAFDLFECVDGTPFGIEREVPQ